MNWRAKRPKDSYLNVTRCSNTLIVAKPPKLGKALEEMKL
jgi:dTDP-4-dehydrorhamnose reductase